MGVVVELICEDVVYFETFIWDGQVGASDTFPSSISL